MRRLPLPSVVRSVALECSLRCQELSPPRYGLLVFLGLFYVVLFGQILDGELLESDGESRDLKFRRAPHS